MKKKNKFSYSTGGTIGALAGQLIPIPGVGPALGSTLGGLLGNGIESLLTGNQRSIAPVNVERASRGNSYAQGGQMLPMQGAQGQFVGPKHEQGGIKIGNKEVEGGETTDVALGSQYVFSKKLKVPGTTMSFADVHKKLVKKGGDQTQIEELARMQEKTRKSADPSKLDLGGTLQSFLPYAGDAINIARGLMPARQIEPNLIPRNRNSDRLRSLTLDTAPQENQIFATQRAFNDTTTSRGARLSSHARTLEALDGLQSQKRNFKTQNEKAAIGLESSIDAQNTQIRNRALEGNLNRRDQRENILSEGFAGAARTNQAITRENNQRAMDTLGLMVGVQNMDPVDMKNMLTSLRELLPSDIYAVLSSYVQQGEIGKAQEYLQAQSLNPSIGQFFDNR